MAICKVNKDYQNWKAGNLVEAFNGRLTELVQEGVVTVIKPDPQPQPELETEEPAKPVEEPAELKKRGRPKKVR